MDDLGVPHVWKPPYQLDSLHLDSAGFFSWQTSSLAPSFPPLNKGWWSSLSRYVQILLQQTIWWIYRLYLVRILCIYLMLYNIIHDISIRIYCICTIYVHIYIYIRIQDLYICMYIYIYTGYRSRSRISSHHLSRSNSRLGRLRLIVQRMGWGWFPAEIWGFHVI